MQVNNCFRRKRFFFFAMPFDLCPFAKNINIHFSLNESFKYIKIKSHSFKLS